MGQISLKSLTSDEGVLLIESDTGWRPQLEDITNALLQ